MKIALNQLLGVSVCSYWWPLNLADNIYESAKRDLEECSENKQISVETLEGTQKANIDEIEIDRDYIPECELKKLVAEYLTDDFDDEKLTKALKKYWIIKKGYSIRKPKFYNYEQDSLDLEIECEEGNRREQYPELIPFVKKYIDEIRVPSYDGYCSFEPTTIEEVDKSDYAYIRAILEKENLIEELKSDLESGIEYIQCNYWEFINGPTYEWNGGTYTLDYDEKKLVK